MVKVRNSSSRTRREKRLQKCSQKAKKQNYKRKAVGTTDNEFLESAEQSVSASQDVSLSNVDYNYEPPCKLGKQMHTLAESKREDKLSSTDGDSDVDFVPGSERREANKIKMTQKYADNKQYRAHTHKRALDRYASHEQYRASMRRKSTDKYASNEQFRVVVRKRSTDKYASDQQFRAEVRKRSTKKYATDEQFRTDVRKRSTKKYATDEQFRTDVRKRSTNKYASDEQFRAEVRKRSTKKYATDEQFRTDVRKRSTDKYSIDEQFRTDVRKKSKAKSREKYAADAQHRTNVKSRAAAQYVQREQLRSEIDHVIDEFRSACQEGPEYVCCVCQRLSYSYQVKHCVVSKYEEKLNQLCINHTWLHECTDDCCHPCNELNGPAGSLWICPTCDRYLSGGKMPLQACCNKLQLDPVPAELLHLNTLEEQLIALTIPFMKVIPLSKGKQPGIKGPVICVKSDLQETTRVLPRPLSDSQIVGIKLKRRLEYRGHTQFKMVHLKRIDDAIKILKDINPFYADVELDASWCDETTTELDTIVVDKRQISGDCDREEQPCSVASKYRSETAAYDECNADDDIAEEHDDSNEQDEAGGLANDSCLQPLDIRADIMQELENHVLSVAPAERSKPHSLLNTRNDEMKCFPTLFPHGINGFDETREEKLSRAKYFNARLLSADLRFAKHSGYIFYAQAQVELERIISGISIQSRKGTQTNSGQKITASMISDTDQLLKLTNSDQVFSHMDSLRGSPQYWKRVMNDLFAMIRQIGIPTWFCTFSAAELSRWAEVIETIARQSGRPVDFYSLDFAEKCEILRSNPVTAVRMFYHRINQLMRLLRSPANPLGKITDYFFRVEFQMRGSPHLHGLYWVKDSPRLGHDSDEDVCSFVDRYVSARNVDESDELYSVVKDVQTHSKSHTRSCKKGLKQCRFNFPRPVADRTSIVRPKSDLLTDEERQQQMEQSPVTADKSQAKASLEKLAKLLNGDVHGMSTQCLLNSAGFADFDEFLQAMSLVTKKETIVLQRGPEDVWVNNYSPNILRAWNANMDIQFITDPYSCVMYILSYISKSEHELGQLLREAKLEMDNNPDSSVDLKAQMKKLGFVYFENREVSVQEAVVRTTGLHLKESSRTTVFVSTDENQTRLSKPLAEIMNVAKHDGDSEDIWVTCLYDKYKARPKTEEFERMCQATFASHYRFISKTEGETALAKGNANVHKLQNDLGFVMKRTQSEPAIVRFPKFSSIKEPEKHHMSMLKLYLPHRSEVNMKPRGFSSYEHFYETGSVRLTCSDEVIPVKAVVLDNRAQYEYLSEHLQEVWQQIQRDGCYEDAWATIAPQSEQERLDDTSERVACDDQFETDDVPDLAASSMSDRFVNSLCSVELLGDSVRSQLRTMNVKQRQIFYYVRQWCVNEEQGRKPKPFMLFVNGGAGVGKSHLIKCVYNEASKILRNGESPLDTTVLLTAPTGTAAFNIGGFTLHSALKIPRKQTRHYEPLADDTLSTLSAKLGNLKILIIDEISMVDRKLLAYVHGRLKQIKRIRFSEKEAWFGNVCILAVGDFYQLPPVRAKCLVKPDSSMGIDLWHDLFSMVELRQIMRQKDDEYFARLLNDIRVQPKHHPLHDDYSKALQSRADAGCVPTEAIHVFATNKGADDHNTEMLTKSCTDIVDLKAADYEKSVSSGKMARLEETKKGAVDDLPDVLRLAKGARVMLTRNIDTSDGLVNGAFGTVDHIDRSSDHNKTCVYITFDNERVGKNQTPHHSETVHRRAVPIKVHEESMGSAHNVIRRQFPVKLAWGCTIHKTQGMTVDNCVVDMAGIFAPGQGYVALSRVTSMNGLFIKNYDASKIYRCEDVHKYLQNMVTVPQLSDSEAPNDVLLSLVHHNVQGLRSKLPDITNYEEMHADALMINETWLKVTDADRCVYVNDYKVERQDRSTNTGRGGVAVYVKDSIAVHRLNTNVSTIEHVAVMLTKDTDDTYILVSIYRPPAQSIVTFAVSLRHLLKFIDSFHCNNLIVTGDFNECLLKRSPHQIYDIFTQEYGYAQQVTSATSRSGSLLDAVYTKTDKKVACRILPTYFSDHDAVKVTLSPFASGRSETTVSPQHDETATVHDAQQQDIFSDCIDSSESHNILPQSDVLPAIHSKQHETFSAKESDVHNTSEELRSSNSTTVPRGLTNLGSTCFANSICQVLFSVADLQPLFEQNNPISTTLNVMKSEIYASQQEPVCPDYLFMLHEFDRWPINEQQDAHDFLLWLLQKLHTEHLFQDSSDVLCDQIHDTTRSTDDTESCSPVTALINGRFTITYRCMQCHYESVRYDDFRSVNVYLHSRQTVVEEADYMTDKPCDSCHALQTNCITSMTHCPTILFVLFVRFSGLVKDNKQMTIPAQLVTKNNTHYKLVAVVNHNGRTRDSGHYTALVCMNKTWYLCNDANVVQTTVPASSSLAYILMYKNVT